MKIVRTVVYTEDDFTNAVIKFQSLIKEVGKYNENLRQKIADKAHECFTNVDNLEKVRANFIALDRLISEVNAYNSDLQAHLSDESDYYFDIAAETAKTKKEVLSE